MSKPGVVQVGSSEASIEHHSGGVVGDIPHAEIHTRSFPRVVPGILEEHFSRHGDKNFERASGGLRVTDDEGLHYWFRDNGGSTRFVDYERLDREWQDRIETIIERTEEVYRDVWHIYDSVSAPEFQDLLEDAGSPETAVERLHKTAENVTGGRVHGREEAYVKLYLETLGVMYGTEEADFGMHEWVKQE